MTHYDDNQGGREPDWNQHGGHDDVMGGGYPTQGGAGHGAEGEAAYGGGEPAHLSVGPEDRIQGGQMAAHAGEDHEQDADNFEEDYAYQAPPNNKAKIILGVIVVLAVCMVGIMVYARFIHTPRNASSAAVGYRDMDQAVGQDVPAWQRQNVNRDPMTALAAPIAGQGSAPAAYADVSAGQGGVVAPVESRVGEDSKARADVVAMQQTVDGLRVDVEGAVAGVTTNAAALANLQTQVADLSAEVLRLNASIAAMTERKNAGSAVPQEGKGARARKAATKNAKNEIVVQAPTTCVLKGATDGSFDGRASAWIAVATGERPDRVRVGEEAPCIGRLQGIYPQGEGWIVRGEKGELRMAGAR